MSFHLGAENIHLELSEISAKLRAKNGDIVYARLDLNRYIGNQNGSFHWGGGGFATPGQCTNLSLEWVNNLPIMSAQLRNSRGDLQSSTINLSERLENLDGHFFVRHS